MEEAKAKKVNITVPADMHVRMEQHKGKFNVSGACQEAIEAHLDRLDLAESEDLIEFLRASKKESVMKDKETGAKEAQSAIKKHWINYPMFREIHKAVISIEQEPRLDFEDIDWWQVFDDESETHALLEEITLELKDDAPDIDVDTYLTGFFCEIADAWDELKEKV